ncbi:MAG: nucleotide exchange factor GrpE [Acidobacteriota bacterium]
MAEEYENEAEPSLDEGDEATESYELDLDSSATADDVIREAMAAVERDGESGNGIELIEVEEEPADDDRLDACQAELEDTKERLLRAMADFDNFRRRSDREKADLRKYAHGEAIKEMLTVLDNLERAAAASGSLEDLRQGVELIVEQFVGVLKRVGVTPIDAIDQPFDPTYHEAVSRSESAEVSQPTVSMEMMKGYMLHDRLLRASMVAVTMPGAPGNGEGDSQ